MLSVQYPEIAFKIRNDKSKEFIFDEVRRKWLVLTPEEWVRQNFIQYIIKVLKYPSSLLAIEKSITINTLKKRCDIVVYKNKTPWMIIECKEVNVYLTQKTLQQILQYNMAIPAAFLIITNGAETRGFSIANMQFNEIETWPVY